MRDFVPKSSRSWRDKYQGQRAGDTLLGPLRANHAARRTEEAAMAAETNLTELTAVIVACFVSNNRLAPGELHRLISATYAALSEIDVGPAGAASPEKPAVPVAESVAHDYLICLNDGRKLRALKRYLWRKYALSPEQYRRKWGLPDDYPMVAPAYSELRAKIAKQSAGGSGPPKSEE
jgi:predicted transcriptional regulator